MHDPVITSIQVARVAVSRLGVLASSAVQARGEADIDALELRIGEAQQLYPEIWRHLDEARTALHARGSDIAAYDRLRAAEAGVLGVTDMVATRDLDWGALAQGSVSLERVKSARFNVEGHARARAACEALAAACPDIDWDALDRADAEQIAAFGSLTARRWWTIAIACAIVGAAVAIALALH